MARVHLNTTAITDWPSYHAECRRALGFPDFYGANRDAWIDCMSSLREEDAAGTARVTLGLNAVLWLEVPDAQRWRARVLEIAAALWDDTAFANRRYVDQGESPAIALVPVDAGISGAAT